MSRKRIGIFGGSFNPVHLGHLSVAEEIRIGFDLQRIIFIPAAVPPHKTTEDLAPFSDRFRMIQLAIEDNPNFTVDDIEGGLSGKSFTVRTLRIFNEKNPDWDIFFLLGLDNLHEIGTWKDPESLFELCQIIVFGRPGYHRDGIDEGITSRVIFSDVTEIGISASEIRNKLHQRLSIESLVPAKVGNYVRDHHLYTD
ncbi:nicotinate-nucleotide adenylyltransferase [candidate division KSB1 bacterium]